MSNTRRLSPPRSMPPAGPLPRPRSAEAAERNLADVIGQAVAFYLAGLLQDLQTQPACLACASAAKRAERDHEIAVANAKAAAEPEPDKPDVKVSQSFTDGARGSVCWGCFDPDKDGYLDFNLPLPVD